MHSRKSTNNRRQFMAQVALATLAVRKLGADPGVKTAQDPLPRKFYMNLSCSRIGVKASFQESVELASKLGFEGVDPDPAYFARLSDMELSTVLEDLKRRNLKLAAGGLPVEFRKDEKTFSEDLKKLPVFGKALQRAGVQRVSTYILPFDDNLTYLQNFRSHAQRLRLCADMLNEHGLKLGLEYVGPKTLWRMARHPFVHTMSETKELIVAIGASNVCLHLDSWHWFMAEETPADLLSLRNEEITAVDLNDAPANLPLDKQVDSSRELPVATGVIPVKVFLEALRKIGYDGPVHAEPFNAALRALPREEACSRTAQAMKKAFAL